MAVSGNFLRTRKRILLAKLETTYGTDAVPVGATDAILTQNLSVKPVIEYVERNVDRATLGSNLSLHTNRYMMMEFDVDLQSSGALGTAPAWGVLLKACGFSQTDLSSGSVTGVLAATSAKATTTVTLGASASVTAGFYVGATITIKNTTSGVVVHTAKVTAYTTGKVATLSSALPKDVGAAHTYTIAGASGTATGITASTTNTIILATAANGASVIDNFYTGKSITISSGTGAGQAKYISGYVGSTRTVTVADDWDTVPDTTSVYSISSGGIAYSPVSSSYDAITLYGHMDGQLRKATGCRGTVSLKLIPKANPMIHFTFTGLWVDPLEATDPVPVTTAFKLPTPVSDDNTPIFTWQNVSQKVYEFDFDISNDVKYRSVINASSVSIVDRKPSGNIIVETAPISIQNWFNDTFLNKALPLNIVHGNSLGSTIQIYAPLVQCFSPTDGDKDGVMTTSLKMGFMPTDAGNDEIKIIAG